MSRPFPVIRRTPALFAAIAVAGALTGSLWLCLVGGAAGASALRATATSTSGGVVLSPLPGTLTAMPGTQISFLGAPADELRGISVVGSSTGRHAGRLESYESAAGASFVPSAPFAPGEKVTVDATLKTSRGAHALSSSFTVAQPVSVAQTEFPPIVGTPADLQSFHSQPALHPATLTVTHAATGAAPGYLFGAPALGPGQYGPMIFDSAGNLVWFRSLPSGEDATEFHVQRYAGKKDLTWWQGRTISFGFGEGEDVIANSAYHTVAVVKAGNGLQADEHEFRLTSEGEAFITAFSPVAANLSSAGGPSSGIALDGVVQEIDIRTGLVMWEWHSLGNVDVSESYSKIPATSTAPFDYFHINSVFVAKDGNVLVSARNTWGIYSISKRTGRVLWRLGGKKSTFSLGQGVPFAWQHNAQLLPGNEISLFDDEGAPAVKPPSRGEIIKLNPATKTATLAAQFLPAKPLITTSQGNLQRLPNGNWLVGFGGLPNFTEYNSQGQITYDARFPTGENSYRVYREPWSGQPTEPPAIAASATGTTTSVYASWNGATTVASWQLLTGPSTSHLAAVSTTPKTGFETTITAPTAPYVQVRALNFNGKTLGTSKAIRSTG
jgi:Arylsulfotransferase (ASST)